MIVGPASNIYIKTWYLLAHIPIVSFVEILHFLQISLSSVNKDKQLWFLLTQVHINQNSPLTVSASDAYNYTRLSLWTMYKIFFYIHVMLNHSLIQSWLGLSVLPSILILIMTCWILFGSSAPWIIIILQSLKDQRKLYNLMIVLIHLLGKIPWILQRFFIHSRIPLAAKYYISKPKRRCLKWGREGENLSNIQSSAQWFYLQKC